MSLDASKIMQVYESCLTLLKAKKSLYVDNHELNALFSRPELNSKEKKNLSVEYIEDGLLKLLRVWSKKFNAYQSLQDSQKDSIARLQFKIDTLEKNTQLLSREDQLFLQIQGIMAEWKHNMNPIEYYNSIFKKELKAKIQQKLLNIKISISKLWKTNPPLYTRRVEDQFKESIIATYHQQLKIDKKLYDTTIQLYNQLAKQIEFLEININENILHKEISLQKNYCFREAHQILGKATRPSDRKVNQYTQYLNEAIKKNYQYWLTFRKSLDYLLFLINQIQNVMSKVKTRFEEKQQRISRLLNNVLSPIAKIFRVDLTYDLTKTFSSFFIIINILTIFRQKIIKRKDFSLKNQGQCREYSCRLFAESSQRYQNFLHYTSIDKKFFEDQAKSEKISIKLLMQSFRDFLQQFNNLTKQASKIFHNYSIPQLQQHEVSPILSKLITSDFDGHSASKQNSNSNSGPLTNKKTITKQKIGKIEEFVGSIYIFSPEDIPQNDKFYSCALGPKLLLHGRLHMLPEGLFFQSNFNKKNLLFGKTKLFIPKSDILQVDVKNTLLVFPDAVLIKTQHGLISFHALGQQKSISDTIKSTYFQEPHLQQGNSQNEKPDFKQMKESKKPSEQKIQQLIKPFQTIVFETTLKKSHLGSIFRRYFSDDKFEIEGKSYSNYKNYSLLMIGGKNINSTILSPPPPIYFQLKQQDKNQESYPQSSIRTHKYDKELPKIPFLSKGGDGQCQQKQTYFWLGSEILVINVLSTVEGFSLTEGMQIFIKYVIKQVNQDVKITISSQIIFAKQSSTNSLIKKPTFNSIKETLSKIIGTIQRCEKSGQGTPKISKEDAAIEEEENSKPSDPKVQILLTKRQVMFLGIGFLIFYLLSILVSRLL